MYTIRCPLSLHLVPVPLFGVLFENGTDRGANILHHISFIIRLC